HQRLVAVMRFLVDAPRTGRDNERDAEARRRALDAPVLPQLPQRRGTRGRLLSVTINKIDTEPHEGVMLARASGLIVLFVHGGLTAGAPPEGAKGDGSLEHLATLYARHELPLPPPNARLVRFHAYGQMPSDSLGFLVEGRDPTKPSFLL